MIFAKLLVTLLGITAVVTVLLWARRGAASSPRGPMRRHWITRLISGTLGAALLVTVAVSTGKETALTGESGKTVRVRMAGAPVPAPPGQPHEIERGRFLIHSVWMEHSPTTILPFHAMGFEIRWPQDRDRIFSSTIEIGGATLSQNFSLDHLKWAGHSPGPLRLEAPSSSRTIDVRTFNSTSVQGGSLEFDRREAPHWHGRASSRPFSVASTSPRRLSHAYFITPIQDGDPLREASLEEFTEWCGRERAGLRDDENAISSEGPDPLPAPAIRFLERFGLACLPLLAAAILLTQLFTRRFLAFAGVVAFLVLYVGTIDRLILQSHLNPLKDAERSLHERLWGCAGSSSTFFFKKVAQRELETVARDERAPGALRQFAREVLSVESERR